MLFFTDTKLRENTTHESLQCQLNNVLNNEYISSSFPNLENVCGLNVNLNKFLHYI